MLSLFLLVFWVIIIIESDCVCMLKDYMLLILYQGNSVVKVSKGDEVLQYKMPFINEVEQEERRMSDLSDWASSVTSAAEMQVMEDSESVVISYRFFTW